MDALPDLPGRAPALQVLRHVLHGARAGRSGALVLVGDPGMGKTTLLGAARRAASGMRVLTTAGIAGEQDTAFAGLSRLLTPVVPVADGVPEPQRAALLAALALAPPAARADRLAPYVGTLSLLQALSAQTPVLLLVDDVHRLDDPSAEALAFCARRLRDERVALVFASRPGDGRGLLRGVPVLDVPPLDDAASLAVLARNPHGASLTPAVAHRLLRVAAGSPLALGELPGLLTPAQRAGAEPLPDPLRPGDAVVAAFREQLDVLTADARTALLVGAASGDGRLASVVPALGRLGCGPRHLEQAEATGLIEIDADHLRFRHPLVPGVCLRLASPGAVRRAHAALAAVLDPRREPERWVRHRAEATVGPDEEVAAALAAVGADAMARGGFASAATTFARAAGLSPSPGSRAERLVSAARGALAAGRTGWAAELAREAAALDPAPEVRGHADLTAGHAALVSGDLDEVGRVLGAGAARSRDPELRTNMLALAAYAANMQDDLPRGMALGRAALVAAGASGRPRALVQAWAAFAINAVPMGGARLLTPHLAAIRAATDGADPSADPIFAHSCIGLALSWMGLADDARAHVERALESLRRTGQPGRLIVPLAHAAQVALRAGRWDAALGLADEAALMCEDTGVPVAVGHVLATQALVLAARGDAERCAAAAARAQALSWATGAALGAVHVAMARALLAAGERRHEEVLTHLAPVAARTVGVSVGDPLVVPWRAEVVEACAQLGRTDEALAHVRVLAEEAAAAGSPAAAALLSRCRALVAPGEYERHLREALAHHRRAQAPFERARTNLALGERLRRDRRRWDARPHLQEALQGFEALGARPWAERARAELEASGARPRAADPDAATRLTRRELEVARAVAEGATNREVAARMFLSDKTIERHLGSVYRKLGLRSRSQLARHLASGAGLPREAPPGGEG